ncbi:hypothetical protein CCHR01_06160 [Colletotrichum chrysophilum]|uniref:Uncharacterized protein n=1 Tax=Colletotrichum chrysophilum TaxID=1836956 RepID=A0AAD9APK1_9PEZI|nr:hypothetical protein CCHR01_06160 [Colletotrichum chrysophilum]
MHEIVKSLSLRIQSEIFARIQSIHPHVEIKPASSTELLRCQRALYRFEIYRILFPQHQDLERDYPDDVDDLDGGMMAQMQFLAGSPPWENEQLGCIYESLWRLIAQVYNDLALHSTKGCRTALYYGDARIEYLLARGLKEINEISLCNTWTERYDLLGFDRPDEPVCDFGGFLRETFEYYEGHCLIECSQMTGAHKGTHYPVGRDTTEDGPRRTWDWVTQRWSGQPNFEARKRIVLVMETARLRACGYVFWDEERMVELGWMNPTSMDWHSDALRVIDNPPT